MFKKFLLSGDSVGEEAREEFSIDLSLGVFRRLPANQSLEQKQEGIGGIRALGP